MKGTKARPKVMFTAAQAAQKVTAGASNATVQVHCRTGSSEIHRTASPLSGWVHCRTGSSEKFERRSPHPLTGSLPHRQLRNEKGRDQAVGARSLPHRQLRKPPGGYGAAAQCSLPHRQLRNVGQAAHGHPLRSLPHRQLRKFRHRPNWRRLCSLPHRQLRKRGGVRFFFAMVFTAAQAAQKQNDDGPTPAHHVHCRTGSSEKTAAPQ